MGTICSTSLCPTHCICCNSLICGDELPVSEVLFFPIAKMPCRFGETCRRNVCNYSHTRTALTDFLHYLDAATSLDVCVFTITCNEIAAALSRAHKRGVKVRIICDGEQMDSKGSDVRSLASEGIRVRANASPYHMHHKFCVVDRKLLLNGSFNWTRQAILGNEENVVITNENSLVQKFLNQFESMWSNVELKKV